MGANDIRLGGVFVEVGGKLGKLDSVLKEARSKVSEFGKGMQTAGAGLAAVGAMITAPLIAAAKSTADLAEETANLQAKTGASLTGIAAMKNVAESTGVGMGAFATGIKTMQRNISSGGKETEAAFGRLGLSMKEMAGMSPEAALGTIADRLNLVTDSNEKTTLAMDILGRSGVDLLPALAGGSAALNQAARDAERFGTVFTQEALDAALEGDKAFDNMTQSIKGLTVSIGSALLPMLTPMINGIVNAVTQARKWVSENPATIQSVLNVGLAVSALGAALTVLGTVIAAAMSPIVLITGGIMLIGMACLALLDVLGITNTGFGDLFNSVRIGGIGLATWWGSMCLYIGDTLDAASTFISDVWNSIVQTFSNAGRLIYQGISWVWEKVASGFDWMLGKISGIMNGLLSVYNDTIGQLTGEINIDFKSGAFAEAAKSFKDQRQASIDAQGVNSGEYEKNKRDRAAAREERRKQTDRDAAELFRKDPNDGSSGISFDASKAKAAVEGIGKKIGQALMGGLPSAGAPPGGEPGADPFKPKPGELGAKQITAKPEMSAVGTFSGFAGGALAARGVFDQQLQEQKTTNQKLDELIKKNTGGGYVLE